MSYHRVMARSLAVLLWLCGGCGACHEGSTLAEGAADASIDGARGDFLSRPTLHSMYRCGHRIGVGRARFRGEVRLLLDGNPVTDPKEVHDPAHTEFTLDEISGVDQLDETQVWTAQQRIDGGPWSEPSEAVSPRDYATDYPDGLPAPGVAFRPLYECAQAIAVWGHLPGATIHVQRSAGAAFDLVGNALGWTSTVTATPFGAGEQVSVAQSLCGEMSAWSEAVAGPLTVSAEPSSILPGAVPLLYDQQQLIEVLVTQGTSHTLTSSIAGPLPMLGSWGAPARLVDLDAILGRPISARETIQIDQALCGVRSTGISAPARSCDELPAVAAVAPREGDVEVILSGEVVPGSTILVWSVDEAREIGDSSGGIINVVRPLVRGELLRVTQQLNESCRSPRPSETVVR